MGRITSLSLAQAICVYEYYEKRDAATMSVKENAMEIDYELCYAIV